MIHAFPIQISRMNRVHKTLFKKNIHVIRNSEKNVIWVLVKHFMLRTKIVQVRCNLRDISRIFLVSK